MSEEKQIKKTFLLSRVANNNITFKVKWRIRRGKYHQIPPRHFMYFQSSAIERPQFILCNRALIH